MRNFLKITSLVFFFFTNLANAEVVTVKWNSEEGLKRLESSKYKNDFYQLADYFQPQINPLYCAVASSVMVLNSISGRGEADSQKELEVKTPKAFGGKIIPFKSYSQLTFFNEKTNKIKNQKVIDLKNITPQNENDAKNFDPGLTLDQLRQILYKTYNLTAKITYVDKVDDSSLKKFRETLKEVLKNDEEYLVMNFDGKHLNLLTNGHVSPIVAFDESSDSVLVMDVAGHKNGWYWAKVPDLMKAMNTLDGNLYRGYLVVLD